MTIENIYDSISGEIDFQNDTLESVVKNAFILGGKAQAALLKLEQASDDSGDLDEYTTGITKLVKPIGKFVDTLLPNELEDYKAGLKLVIINDDKEVETVLEEFADFYLDTIVAVDQMAAEIDALQGGS